MPFPVAFAVLSLLLASPQTSSLRPDPPVSCGSCAEWNGAHQPFKVFGNTYYVGVAGLSAMLITSDQGLILLDAALPQSAPLIDANIRALGFRTEDIRLIVTSHAHYDHVGGVAAFQRASGAVVAASPSSARALEAGFPTPDDPQVAFGESNRFPAAKPVRVIADGEVLRVGPLAITAHFTPGHTPGSTTWSWQSCEAGRCLNIVYADSLNPVSHDSFRFSGGPHGNLLPAFRNSVETVAALPCDIVVSVHPGFTDLAGKLKRRAANPAVDPFIDGQGCRSYAADAMKRLDTRSAQEAR
jgi:metallo-beta-lactamase class B